MTRQAPRCDLSPCLSQLLDYAFDGLYLRVKVRNGVKMGEGDGTVSLLSLGAMCVEGWKRKRWNPGGVKIITTEVRLRVQAVPSAPTLA